MYTASLLAGRASRGQVCASSVLCQYIHSSTGKNRTTSFLWGSCFFQGDLIERIKDIVEDYNKHAMGSIPAIFFTVALWMASQNLIQEAVKQYAPALQTWQLAVVEIFVASFGLYWVTREPKAKKGGGEDGHLRTDIAERISNP